MDSVCQPIIYIMVSVCHVPPHACTVMHQPMHAHSVWLAILYRQMCVNHAMLHIVIVNTAIEWFVWCVCSSMCMMVECVCNVIV